MNEESGFGVLGSMARLSALALALLLAAGGCESRPLPPPLPAPAPTDPSPPPLDVFNADRAWNDLLALTGAAADASASEPARAHLVAALGRLGLEVREIATPAREPAEGEGDGASTAGSVEQDALAEAPPPLRHVVGVLPGASPDLFVLVAPYDPSGRVEAPPALAAAEVSGAALLLELGRVLSTRELPYTTWLVFLTGESGEAEPRRRGSRELAERMARDGDLERTRLAVFFERICTEPLRVVRDLPSHRMYREEFFRAAQRHDLSGVFSREHPFERAEAGHRAFLDRGLRATVAIAAAAPEADTPAVPGCARAGLESVGPVALDALRTIGRRLEKIDRFSRLPLSGVEPAVAPPPGAAPPDAEVLAPGAESPEAAEPRAPDPGAAP